MPEIEITEDQYQYLQALQDDIQTQVVGKYAHVRMVDAVQYLIDNHEGEINATVTEPTDGPAASTPIPAADDPTAAGAGNAAGTGADAETGGETGGETVGESSAGGGSDQGAAADDPGADADDGGADADDAGGGADGAAASDGAAGGDDAAASGSAPAAPMAAGGGGDDDGMLSAMMALMDTHDDKWETAAGDTGYEVELPDGSTEAANTQDDVRALLFKHYE